MTWTPKPRYSDEVTMPLLALAPAIAALVLAFAMSQLAVPKTPARTRASTGLPVTALTPPPAVTSEAIASEPKTYTIVRALRVGRQMKHGDWVWNDEGVPDGPMLVTVDTKTQLISVFRAGYEIGLAVIAYGADQKPTPLGIFPITQKDADHRSSIYQNAPMPWMLRLTNDGVAIHGTNVRRDWATNGCVGVPPAFAKLLFGQVKLGDRVVITRGHTMHIGDRIPIA